MGASYGSHVAHAEPWSREAEVTASIAAVPRPTLGVMKTRSNTSYGCCLPNRRHLTADSSVLGTEGPWVLTRSPYLGSV